ncbi:MAG TPA: FAD-dependent oxidoreductase, partial [Thermoanaerobaculia bacterium]
YTRIAEAEGKTLLIVGGEDRGVGKPENDEERYRALEQYCRARYGVTEFAYRWSGQINEPADALPLIGESAHGKNVWTSTGYSGTGMTYGTLAAMLLADLALGRANRFAKLYDPSRADILSVARNVIEAAGTITKRLVEKVTGGDVEAPTDASVAEGEGKIVMRGERKVAVSKIDGQIRALDPTCTHMGCTVAWNGAEKSWDCPCHGSRFDVFGRVLNGPATKALERREDV